MQWFRDRGARGRPRHPDVLTPAEWRVLERVREGLPNAEIAVRLGLSVPTVKTHVSSMLAKLELRDRSELAAWDGEPAEASRSALARSALGAPLGWMTAGAGLTSAKVAGGAVASVLFIGSLVAVYTFFDEASDEARLVPSPTTMVANLTVSDDLRDAGTDDMGNRLDAETVAHGAVTALVDGVRCTHAALRGNDSQLVIGLPEQPAECQQEGARVTFENGLGGSMIESFELQFGTIVDLTNYALPPR